MISRKNRPLIAVKAFLKPEFLSADVELLLQKRADFIGKAVLPSYLSENSGKTAMKALSQLQTQIYSPEGQIKYYWSTPDRWPHKNMWLWDTCFHSIGLRHYDVNLARELVSAVFDLQQPNSLIPHSGTPYSVHDMTQPPSF